MAKKVSTNENFDKAIAAMEKLYGKGSILQMGGTTGQFDQEEIISSGSLSLDWKVLGIGGFAKGRLYEIMGWEGTGKSTICGHAIAECQKKGGHVVYVDAEHSMNNEYFEKLGVDIGNLHIVQPTTAEEAFNIISTLVKTDYLDLIILDSDTAILPKAILESDIGEATIGKKAKLNSEAYLRLKQDIVKHDVCMLVVSQYREKIGVMYGPSTTTSGGNALKYYADCRLEISRSTISKDGDSSLTGTIKVKSVKNKMFPPYKNCQFEIVYGMGIYRLAEVLDLATEYEIVNRSGAWYSYMDSKIGQGRDKAVETLEDNPELYDEISNKVIKYIEDANMQNMRKKSGE